MRISVCDDEKAMAIYIADLVKRSLPECNIEIFTSGEELLEFDTKTDIAFLDIELKNINGIDTASELQKRYPDIIIIFISSYSSYVTDAFSVHAFQYLLKPVNVAKFNEEFSKALNSYKLKHYAYEIKSGTTVKYIAVKDILYIETFGRRLKIKTTDDVIEFNGKLKDEYAVLKAYGFTKAHQGCIVNMFHITGWSRDKFTMSDNITIPITRSEMKSAHDDFTVFIGKALV